MILRFGRHFARRLPVIGTFSDVPGRPDDVRPLGKTRHHLPTRMTHLGHFDVALISKLHVLIYDFEHELIQTCRLAAGLYVPRRGDAQLLAWTRIL